MFKDSWKSKFELKSITKEDLVTLHEMLRKIKYYSDYTIYVDYQRDLFGYKGEFMSETISDLLTETDSAEEFSTLALKELSK